MKHIPTIEEIAGQGAVLMIAKRKYEGAVDWLHYDLGIIDPGQRMGTYMIEYLKLEKMVSDFSLAITEDVLENTLENVTDWEW